MKMATTTEKKHALDECRNLKHLQHPKNQNETK